MHFCRINRLGQKISIPILLAERLDPFILLGSTLIPAAAYASIYKLYLLPRKKRALKDRVKDLREEHKEFIRQKRQEARDAVDVMERSVEAKLAQERDRNGMSPSFFCFQSLLPPFPSCLPFDWRLANTREHQVLSSSLLITDSHPHSPTVVSSFLKRWIKKEEEKGKKKKLSM